MATAKISFDALMAMKQDELIAYAKKIGKMAELAEISTRFTTHKKYPKVQKPMKQTKKNVADGSFNPEKYTWQADKTKKPTIEKKPITFFEAKAAFATEVLKLEKKAAKAAEPNWRDAVAAAAENA